MIKKLINDWYNPHFINFKMYTVLWIQAVIVVYLATVST